MGFFNLIINLVTASQAGADVKTTCTAWHQPPAILEYEGQSYAVGQGLCRTWDPRPVPLNLTHGPRPTDIICIYTKRDDVQACHDDGNVGLFASAAAKKQAAQTRAALKHFMRDKKLPVVEARPTTTTAEADAGR